MTFLAMLLVVIYTVTPRFMVLFLPPLCQWLIPVILALWDAEIWRITVQDKPRQIVHETSVSRIIRTKYTGGVAKEAECLLCKHEDLSSNTNPNPEKM
jgi:hypothetical protein